MRPARSPPRRSPDNGALAQVKLEIEPQPHVVDGVELCGRVGRAVQGALSFRPDVVAVPPGSLPRFEMKAKRFVRRQQGTGAQTGTGPPA